MLQIAIEKFKTWKILAAISAIMLALAVQLLIADGI